MSKATRCPIDLTLVLHDRLSDGFAMSKGLLASADFDGTLQLMSSGWERVFGYRRGELQGKTLAHLLWSDRGATAGAVAAILDKRDTRPVDLRIRCRDGRAKCLRLNRLYDKPGHSMRIVGEEIADNLPAVCVRAERRRAIRHAQPDSLQQ
jgi:PAS domain S-box-containing protein